MENQITIREARTETDVAAFWEQLYEYFRRDVLPDPEDEDRAYFFGEEYRSQVQQLHARPQDRLYYLFFCRDGRDIGFSMASIYTSEDGKCFVEEFCVLPEFRGSGTGRACAKVLLRWAEAHGAHYAELNYGSDPRRLRFWQSVGFQKNGADEWGDPLLLLPPQETLPFTVEVLSDPEDWQLKKLENGYLQEIGEEALTEEKQKRLSAAIREGKITFFLAKRGYRAVGMCSVVRCFSTFACADNAVLEDFYVEPIFRKQGIARQLAETARRRCVEWGIASLTVCCAPCDEKMYQSLGFTVPLGRAFACLP